MLSRVKNKKYEQEKAKVIVNDEWLKINCFLFQGSIVTILKQRGTYYDCVTNAGKKVTLRANEIKIKK